jgi:transcriptional regulator with XRE-family HTH domain
MKKAIFEPAYRALIASLREARLRGELRQEDVAARLGVKRTWLSKVETHEIRLDVVQLIRLARVYGIRAYKLVKVIEGVMSG